MKLDRSQLVDRSELTSNIHVATHQVVKSSPALLSVIMNGIVSFTPSFSQLMHFPNYGDNHNSDGM